MGFFDKLFEKKYCSICGKQLGLIQRKLVDGYICGECKNKLSRWFSDRKESTIEQIKEQLAYREENRNRLESFQVTHTYGNPVVVRLDDENGQFIVSNYRNFKEDNPDIIKYADITGVDYEIVQQSYMEKKDENGKILNPRRFDADYDFKFTVHVNNPYFEEMRFDLNDSMVRIVNSLDPKGEAKYIQYQQMSEELKRALQDRKQEALNTQKQEKQAQNQPKKKTVCPRCGANTMPDANGCCEYCGSPIE